MQQTDLYCVYLEQQNNIKNTPIKSLEDRLQLLTKLEDVLIINKALIADALKKDFNTHSSMHAYQNELLPILQAISYVKENMAKWMKPSARKVPNHLKNFSAWVEYHPVGVLGIISPWNYPFYLTLIPLIYGLAAGNNIMVKPSELSSHSALVLKTILNSAFPRDQVEVILGDREVSMRFSALPFGHLLFTGSTATGKEIMKNAATNLTPLTLELGGKSPVILDKDCNLQHAIERILSTKLMNSGQTCTAPDYLLIPKEMENEVVSLLESKYVERFAKQDEYPSIINEDNRNRLKKLINEAVEMGATIIELEKIDHQSANRCRFPFTLVTNLLPTMQLMQIEIFGPILPIISYHHFDEVVNYLVTRDSPLAIYYFGCSQIHIDQLNAHTKSGAFCINDVFVQISIDDLPFGGVGMSGFGRYHSKEGFVAFSNVRSLIKNNN